MKHSTASTDELISQLQSLQLSHQQELDQLRKRHRRAEQAFLSDITASLHSRACPKHHRDKSGTPLAIGDTVRILTSALTGKKGDLATVTSLTKRVNIRVHKTNTITNRVSHNLNRLPPDSSHG